MSEGLSGVSNEELNFRNKQREDAKKSNIEAFKQKEEETKRHEKIEAIIEDIQKEGIPLYFDNSLKQDSGFDDAITQEKSPEQLRIEVELDLSEKLREIRKENGNIDIKAVNQDIKNKEEKWTFLNKLIPKTLKAQVVTGAVGVVTTLFGAGQVFAEEPQAITEVQEMQQVQYAMSAEKLAGLGLNKEANPKAFDKVKDFIAGGKFWGDNDKFDGTAPLIINLTLNGLGKTAGKPTVQKETAVLLSPSYMNQVCEGKNFQTAAELTAYIKDVVEKNNALKNFKNFMQGANICFYFTDENSFYCFSASKNISSIDRLYVDEIRDPNIPHFVKFTNDGKSKVNKEYMVKGGSLNGAMAIDLKTGGLVVVDGATCQITGDYSYTPVLSETGEETGEEIGHKVTFRNEFENIGDRQKVFEDMVRKVEELRKDGTFNFDRYITLKDSSGHDIFMVAIGGTDGLNEEEYINNRLKPTVEKINNRIDPDRLENSGPTLILRTTDAGLNATYKEDKGVNRIYINQENVNRSESKQKKEDMAVTLFILLTEYHGLEIDMLGGEEKKGLLKSLMSRDTIEEWYNNKSITKGEYTNLKIGADNDIIQYIVKWYGIKKDQKDEIYKDFSKKYGVSDGNKWTSELLNSVLGKELKKFWNI